MAAGRVENRVRMDPILEPRSARREHRDGAEELPQAEDHAEETG